MRIGHVQLRQFRNHTATAIRFGAAANVLVGENGQGKTNVLEALSYLCLTKSFYASSDSVAVQQRQTFFDVSGEMVSDGGTGHQVRVLYDDASAVKRFLINGKDVGTFSSVVGQFPIVILSPENSSITFGTPADRRKFVDLVISQSSAAYLEDMLEYRRILRQRNRLLTEGARSGVTPAMEEALGPWTEALVATGARIFERRRRFFEEFAPYIGRAYASIAGGTEVPAVLYAPQVSFDAGASVEEISRAFQAALKRRAQEEWRAGTTLSGPHRDEAVFSLNELHLRSYASQGQHKTFLVALKIAEFSYLRERVREIPILLLDDVFSELDDERSRRLIDMLGTMGQIFITTTSDRAFHERIPWDAEHRRFVIRAGEVVGEHEVAA